jgi:hypothetical protein
MKLAPFAVLALALVALPRTVRADSCAEPTVNATANGSTVTICSGGCDGKRVLLREDEALGAIVQLTGCDSNACFLDECVPPGTYRYGLETPFPCNSCAGAVILFVEQTVTGTADPSCMPTGPAATPYSGKPPWGSGASITQVQSCPGHGACAASSRERGSVFAVQALAVAVGIAMRLRARRRRGR